MFGGWRAQWACPHHRGFSSHINMTLTPARMNTHTLNTRPSKYVRQKLTELKAEVENSTIIIGDINIPLSIMDRTTRWKISKETGFNTHKESVLQTVCQMALLRLAYQLGFVTYG